MTFLGIGAPDSQDQGSFTSGRVLDQIDVNGVAAGGSQVVTLDQDILTNLTLLLINAEGPAAVTIVPLTPSGNEITTARWDVTYTEPGAIVAAVQTFGGGLEIGLVNCGVAPVNFQIIPETLFKSTVRTTYVGRLDDAIIGTATNPGDTVETFIALLWGQYDRVAGIVDASDTANIDVHWELPVFDGGWTIHTIVETLGSVTGAGTFPFEVPVRAPSGRVVVTNATASDPVDVTISIHLTQTN